jgi:hypothetical protein
MEPKANLTLVTVRQSQWGHFFQNKLIRYLFGNPCLEKNIIAKTKPSNRARQYQYNWVKRKKKEVVPFGRQ